MAMLWLDHVNIRTTQLDEMSAFYENVLGLKRGKRPHFGFGGAWHYCGGNAIVHLVELTDDIKPGEAQVEHYALRATGSVKAFQTKLRKHDAPYNVVSVEDLNMRQINVFDPDGNKIEVQFVATEDDDLEPFWGSKKAARRMKKGMKLNKTGALSDRKSKAKTTKTNAALGVPAPLKSAAKKRPAARRTARTAA
jgi:catechol 2,3-dioxygenase-like lactoylglutathione lyase family enzyme